MKYLKLGAGLAAIVFAFMFSPNRAIAGAREGAIRSIEPEVKYALARSLKERRYLRDYTGDRDLERAIAAYLWNNRDQLPSEPVPKHREVDLVICLMVYEGDQHLRRFAGANCEIYLGEEPAIKGRTLRDMDSGVVRALARSLREKGYLSQHYSHRAWELLLGIRAYLWDNRDQLPRGEPVPRYREVDLAIRLMRN